MNQEIDVLLIEDNPSDAEMTIRALKKNNLANRLLHLKDGAQGLQFLFGEGVFLGRQTEQIPKVILLDLKMQKITGIEVLQKIKADKRTRKIPVVVLTSSKEDPDIQQCRVLGASVYLIKPVEFDAFHKAISGLGLYWLIVKEADERQTIDNKQ